MNDLRGPAAWPTWFIGRSESAFGSGLAARSLVNAFTLCDGYRGKPVTAIGQILRVANTDRQGRQWLPYGAASR